MANTAVDAELAFDPDTVREEPAIDAIPQEKADYAFGRWAVQRDPYAVLYKLWARCILFLLGKQNLTWNESQRRWSADTNVPAWRQQPVTNLVFAVYRTAVAKLVKQKPTWDVVPPSRDSEDREAAKLSESLLHQFWRALRIGRLFAKAAGWLLATGNVALRPYWDAEAGKVVRLTVPVDVQTPDGPMEVDCPCDEDGDPYLDDAGQPDLEQQAHAVFEGDVAIELISPTSIRYNPDAKSKEEATEYFIGYVWPAARAAKEWDIPIDELTTGGGEELEDTDDLIASAIGSNDLLGISRPSQGLGSGDRSDEIGPRVLVIEYHRKPCLDYPEGRHWVQVNRRIVWPKLGDPEYPDGEATLIDGFWPPVVDLDDVPVPDQPHAMGLLSQVCPLNREYNAFNAKVAEHNVMMAMGGKWVIAPEDKGMAITTDPGQKLVSKGYVNGRPPIQAPMEALPAPVYAERERILNDLQLVSGIGELQMGKKPEGVTSGRGFLVLQEAVDSVLTPTLMNMEEAWQECGRRMLVLAQRNYKEDRLVKVRGENGLWEVRSFKGADLRESVDVQVQIGSSFPWSKSAKQDLSLALLQALPTLGMKADGVTPDHTRISKILDQGGIQAFEPEADPDQVEIQLEHAAFEEFDPEKGKLELPEIGFWQNHAAHLAEHFDFLKASHSRFKRWSPMAQKAFIEHCLLTQATIAEQVQAMAPLPEPIPAESGADAGAAKGGPKVGIGQNAGASPAKLEPADFAAAGQ